MTESSFASSPAATPKVSFWEDVIDIFISPAPVFRRRELTSVWPPMLFVAITIGVIFFATFNTIEPIFEAEFRRNTAKALAANPQAAEQMGKALAMTEAVTKYTVGVIMLVSMFLLGCFSWLIGKLVGSAQTFHAALVVAAWSYMPRIIGSIAGAIQGLIMDPAQLTSQMSISLSPARFMDPDASNPLLFQLAGRFDLITLWVTVLLAIGLYVTGKVSKERAIVFGILMWLVGALPALRQGYMLM